MLWMLVSALGERKERGMTREEAIERIKSYKRYLMGGNPIWSVEEVAEAFDMAIEALSADAPKGDLISRQWLLEVYGDYIGDNGEPKYHVPLEVVRQNIKDAPSADAVTKIEAEWKTDADGCWCSNCESYFFNDEDGEFVVQYDYCPDCGASMKRPF